MGGLPLSQMKIVDLVQSMSNCALSEFPFFSSLYTWWNERIAEDSIFKILDRVFGNDLFLARLQSE